MAEISHIRDNRPLSLKQRISLTVSLSTPAMLAQLSSIAMQFIDASMVGHISADASAAIGLVSTTTWLFWGILSALATGFGVQVAHFIGSKKFDEARSVLRQSITACLLFGSLIGGVGMVVSGPLPHWLGGNETVSALSSTYFLIFAAFLPALQFIYLGGSMLRCSGNMRIPSMLNILMCVLDVVFNFFMIYPTREVEAMGRTFTIPGAGLGLEGAAWGTGIAETIVALLMMWYLVYRSSELKIAGIPGSFRLSRECMRKSFNISLPMAAEHVVICGAQILTTVIVAPLGTLAIAANSLAITAESLCYMPGYGISDAATTLVGHSIGAGRRRLARSFAYICISMGMIIMGAMGVVMYVAAEPIMSLMTPFADIQALGVMCLRTEAWAEPMFAASIVAYGVFVGAGRTLLPCLMNFGSIWGIRLTLAAWLTPLLGLFGMWLAMCVELCFRGLIFIVAVMRGKWLPSESRLAD